MNLRTIPDKLVFVDDLIHSIMISIKEDIEAGKIPDQWDEIELRQLIADRFASSTYKMDRKRKSAYVNEVIVRNL